MKRIIQGLVLATLVSSAQASPFPGNGDPVSLPSQWTYADHHAGAGNERMGSAIPGNGDPVTLPSQWTYADRHAGEGNMQVGSAIRGNEANAATGFTVTHEQELQVTAGMSATEVRQAIGSPISIERFGNEAGPTWTYRVAGSGPYEVVFDIDFGADGRVASVSETESSPSGD